MKGVNGLINQDTEVVMSMKMIKGSSSSWHTEIAQNTSICSETCGLYIYWTSNPHMYSTYLTSLCMNSTIFLKSVNYTRWIFSTVVIFSCNKIERATSWILIIEIASKIASVYFYQLMEKICLAHENTCNHILILFC